jgi:voltage-gated hydrogen channel 1
VFLRGVDEEIASLVVILRLWRFFKIIEEMSAGAQEEMDAMESRMVRLDVENKELRRELAKIKGDEHV